MTAPAAAPSSAPIPPPAPRASAHPPADAHAFAAMLDSLPSSTAKPSASTTEKQPHPSDEPQQDQSQHGHAASHSLLSDGALLMSLPFALRAAMTGENPAAATNAPSPPTAATQGPKPKDDGISIAAGGKAATVGRLIGERAFHFGASSASFASEANLSAGSAVAAELAQADATPATPLPGAAPPTGDTTASIANLTGAAATNRVSPARLASHEAARSARKSEVSASPPAAGATNPAAAVAAPDSGGGGKAPDDRSRDPGAFALPSASQTSPFGALLSASLAAGPSFAAYASTAGVAAASVPMAATAVAPSAAPAAPPVKEIDVDLSPGGLENVSMTMRLANDKLSVVIRAASSETLSSIEGARDAIADRLAAIGQPLDSLIVKQTGLNADGNTNANAASADDSSTQAGGGRDGSNDASSSRRGAGRDRSF